MSANFLVHVCEHFEKSADKHFSSCLRTLGCTSTYFRVHVCGLFIKVHRQTFLVHVYMDFVQVYANKSTYFSSPQTYFYISCLHGFLQVYGDKSTKLVCGLDKFSPRGDAYGKLFWRNPGAAGAENQCSPLGDRKFWI